MAIRIDTQLSGKTFYSNALNEIRISTTASSVQVQLKVNEETVFSSMYYAAYGVVQVRNLSSFFEALMEEREVSLLGFTVKAIAEAAAENAVSSTFFVLYCRDAIIDIPAETFLQDYFLTTHVSRFTTAQSCEHLSLYRPDSAGGAPITLRVKMWLSLPDGRVVSDTYQTQLSAGVGVVGISLPVPDVLLHARAAYADCRLLSFELTVDKRRCMFRRRAVVYWKRRIQSRRWMVCCRHTMYVTRAGMSWSRAHWCRTRCAGWSSLFVPLRCCMVRAMLRNAC